MQGIQKFSSELKPSYAGDQLHCINGKEEEVLQTWKELLERVRRRAFKLGESDEYQRLLMLVSDLLLWIQDLRFQIAADSKPRYVCLTSLIAAFGDRE